MALPKSALEKASEFYTQRGDNFLAALDYHQRFGLVVVMHDCVILARPCREDAPFNFCFPADANAWYIHYVYGEGALGKMLDIGYALGMKRIGFTRSNLESDIRFYDTESLRRKQHGTV